MSKFPTLYVVIDTTPGENYGEFHGAYCNEITAAEKQYQLDQYLGGSFSIVEYQPKVPSPECRERQPEPADQLLTDILGK